MSEGPRLLRELSADRIVAVGDRVEIWSPRPMEGWVPKRFRRLAITIEGLDGRYLVEEVRGLDGATVHVLARWPEDLRDLPGGEVHYDAAFVERRDAARVEKQNTSRSQLVLALLGPLVGFLWSKHKQNMHERWGLHPRNATRASLWLEGIVLLMLELFTFGTPVATFLVIAVFGLDLLFRGSSMLTEDFSPLGFWEWPFAFERSAVPAPPAPGVEHAIEDDGFERRIAGDLALSSSAVGVDRLFRDGDAFVIHAARSMHAWDARKYRKLAITIEGVRCLVVEDDAKRDRARYRLEPWPKGFTDMPLAEITYDEAYVAAREEAAAQSLRTRESSVWLTAFSALIGFLWLARKRDLEERFGISTARATSLSVIVELAVTLFFAGSYSIATDRISWPLPPKPMFAIALFFGIDLVARVLVALRERGEHLGFWEFPAFLGRQREDESS
jgi:uncharacterized membrane protein HdeD (DUF308 family)